MRIDLGDYRSGEVPYRIGVLLDHHGRRGNGIGTGHHHNIPHRLVLVAACGYHETENDKVGPHSLTRLGDHLGGHSVLELVGVEADILEGVLQIILAYQHEVAAGFDAVAEEIAELLAYPS